MSEGEPPTSDEPAEHAGIEDEQEGKGYGADEGERDEAIESA